MPSALLLRGGNLVRDQTHQAPIAPGLAGAALSGRKLLEPFRGDFPDQRVAPGAGLGLLRDLMVERAETVTIVAQASWRVQIDGFKRSHKRPAQTEAVLDRLVYIRAADVPVLDQAEGFAEQRPLKAVDDEPRNFPLHYDRRLPHALLQRAGARYHRLVGPGSRDQFNQRHQRRWVDGVRHQAAVPALKLSGKARCGNARGRTGQNGVRASPIVHRGEDFLFRLYGLGYVFLDISDVLERLCQARYRPDPLAHVGGCFTDEALGVQVAKASLDQIKGRR